MGLNPGPETFVGIYAQNCPEWILTEQGLYCQSMVIVPLYDTLGPEACNFIINQGEELPRVFIAMKRWLICLQHIFHQPYNQQGRVE